MVAFGFLPQTFGRWQGSTDFFILWLQVERSEHSEVAGTVKLYLLKLENFELFVLTGWRGYKTSNSCLLMPLAPEPLGENFTVFFPLWVFLEPGPGLILC